MSAYTHMNTFYSSINIINKWAVFGVLRELYNDKPLDFEVSSTDNYLSWEMIRTQITRDRFKTNIPPAPLVISKMMNNIISTFKDKYLSIINCEEFEAYVLCKIFLECMLDENIKKFPLYCMNFTNILQFLESVDLLYKQKFNIKNLKIIFHDIFYAI